ncbi:MAG: hypothetical protein ACLSAF_08285 [Intestinimonas sp.]
MGAAVGVAAGICMDLAAGERLFLHGGLWLRRAHDRRVQSQSKTACAVAYVLSNAVTVLWAWDGGLRLSLLYEVFSASVLFLLLPDRLLRKAAARLSQERGMTPGTGPPPMCGNACGRRPVLSGSSTRP